MVLLFMGYLSSGWLARKLRRPVQMKSIAEIERRAFHGTLPTVECQRRLYAKQRIGWWSVPLTAVYLSHFVVPYACAAWLHRHHRARWRRWNAEFVLVSAAGLVMYVVLPSAPPWMASEEGMIEPVVRTSGDGLELLGLGRAKQLLDLGQENSNTVAAVPSIHAAHSLLVPLLFWEEASPTLRTFSALYPIAMGATLVATAEHYVVDVGLGFAFTLVAHAVTKRMA
jgi:PAP2 superfamily